MWVLRSTVRRKPLLQRPHLFGFSPVCTSMWYLSWQKNVNTFPHRRHLWVFSPVCVTMWCLRLLAVLNTLPQYTHQWGLWPQFWFSVSPVCCWCSRSSLGSVKLQLQMVPSYSKALHWILGWVHHSVHEFSVLLWVGVLIHLKELRNMELEWQIDVLHSATYLDKHDLDEWESSQTYLHSTVCCFTEV